MRLKELIYQTVLDKKRIRIVGNRCEDLPGVEIDFHAAWSLVDAGLLNGRCYVQPALPYCLVYHNDALDTRSHWSERMVAQLIGAELAPPRTPGYDAILPDGRRVQIKSRCWYMNNKTKQHAFTLRRINKGNNFDVLIIALTSTERPNDPTAFDFFALESTAVQELAENSPNDLFLSENSPRFKALQKYRCDVHGLRRAFGLPIETAPKESTQPVLDLFVKQPHDIIPYDARYETDDFYAESVVAHMVGGEITSQWHPGHDVVMRDGTKISVKMSTMTHNFGGSYRIEFGNLYDNAQYDLIVAPFWCNLRHAGSYRILDASFALIPKLAADVIKKKSSKSYRIRFTPTENSPSYKKLKPFLFTLDHLVELGAIGYEKFYEKYLRKPTEVALRRYAS